MPPQIKSIAVLLGLALALSLVGLAYEQVRTQRAEDAETIQRLRRQLREAELPRSCHGSAAAAPTMTTPAAAATRDTTRSFIYTINMLPYSTGDLVMMTFATGGVRDMLENWVRHVRMLKLPILVAAMDADVIAQCNAEQFECYSCVQEKEKVPRYIRGDFAGFRALGVRKARSPPTPPRPLAPPGRRTRAHPPPRRTLAGGRAAADPEAGCARAALRRGLRVAARPQPHGARARGWLRGLRSGRPHRLHRLPQPRERLRLRWLLR